MANVKVKDHDANAKYLKAAGAGTDIDPYIPEHTVSGSVAVTDNAGSLTVDGPLTDTELRAADVAVTLAGETVGLAAGTNNIGDVDVLTLPVRDRTTDNVGVALSTDAIMSDTTVLTPKFAIIDAASSGDNTLVAAVADKKIRVLAAFLVAAGGVNVRFESGAAGTALTGQMNLVANTGFVLPFNPVGWFEAGTNTLLNLELSAAVSVDGSLVYVEV